MPAHPPPAKFTAKGSGCAAQPRQRCRRRDQQAPRPPAVPRRLHPTPVALVPGRGGEDPSAQQTAPGAGAPRRPSARGVPRTCRGDGGRPAAPAHGARSGPVSSQPRRKFPDVSAGGRGTPPACRARCPPGRAAAAPGLPLPPAARHRAHLEAAPPAPRGGRRGVRRGALQGALSRPRGLWREAGAAVRSQSALVTPSLPVASRPLEAAPARLLPADARASEGRVPAPGPAQAGWGLVQSSAP